MGINTAIDTVHGIVLRSVIGELKADDVKEAWERLMVHPEYRHDMNIIWDIREADMTNLSSGNIRELAYYFTDRTSERERKIKLSIVVHNDFLTGLSRMFQAYAQKSAFDIMVSRDLEQALEWARQD